MTKIACHRGLHIQGYQENTLEAITMAFKDKADQVEFDVHLTSDGIWILHHDRTFYGNEYPINLLRYDDLSSRADELGVVLNTLEEVIGAHKTNWLNIECKADSESAGKSLMHLLEENNRYDFFHISSFNRKTLEGVRKVSQIARISLLGYLMFLPSWIHIHQQLGLFSINPLYFFTYRRKVANVHRRGVQVQTWTVNSANALTRMMKIGVDVVITDNLSLAQKTRRQVEKDNSEK